MPKNKFTFILSNLFHPSIRTVSIIGVGMIFILLFAVSLFVYRNTISALEYYTPSDINNTRVVLSKEAIIFDMFAKNGGGISDALVAEIKSDPLFDRTRIFSFVETNILGGFDVFQFHFDVDIPVFSLDDSAGELSGFGISPSMMHFYNLELAGSHPLFPQIDTEYLKGKKVSLTFGASKIFDLGNTASSPLLGSIVSIDRDYPGFGIVASKRQVDEKLREIGAVERQPYKIIAYMKDVDTRSEILAKYRPLNPLFDADHLEEKQKQYRAIFLSVFGVGLFFGSIVLGLILLLFFGYFREKKSIFSLLHMYGISGFSRHILLYGEAIMLISLGIIGGGIFISLLQYLIVPSLSAFFMTHGVLFPIEPIHFPDIAFMGVCSYLILVSMIIIAAKGHLKT